MKRPTLTTFLLAAAMHTFAATPSANESVNNSNLTGGLLYQLLIGEISAYNGDTASAFALMLDAARKGTSERLYERAVELALSSRNGESALLASQAWARSFPKSTEAHRYVVQILVGLNKTGELPDAIQKTLATVPAKERAATIAEVSRFLSRASNKAGAATAMEIATTADQSSATNGPAAWSSIGALRLLAGDTTGALEAAKRGNALNAVSDDLAGLALALMDAKLTEGEELIRKTLAVRAAPDIRLAYTRRLIDAQRNAEAYQQTKLLTQQSPEYADGWILRGSLEMQEKMPLAAEISLKKYVALVTSKLVKTLQNGTERGLTQAFLLLAQLAEQDKRYDEAGKYLDRISGDQDALRIQIRRANLMARQGKIDEARRLIRNAPATQPGDSRTKLVAEVQLLRDSKIYDSAYLLLSEAIRQDPQDMDLVYDQAMVAEKLGKLEEMEKLLRQVIAGKPDFHHAYNALGYSFADRGINLPEARQLITKALEFAPADPYIVDSLAWVEFRSGNLDEAFRLLQQAYKTRPDAEIGAHLGEVQWAKGMKAEAQATWNEGLVLNPENETLLETMKRLLKK